MVLGKIHLTTLAKVRDKGPIQTGIHPCIGGLNNADFVKQIEEGYILTPKGEAALIVYGDMGTTQRELLMRIYSHRQKDMRFSTAQAGTGQELQDLIDLDYVTVEGEIINLTTTGVTVWEDALQGYQTSLHPNNREKSKAKKKQSTVTQPDSKVIGMDDRLPPQPLSGKVINPTMDVSPQNFHPDVGEGRRALPSGDLEGGCETCINKQVLEMIAAKYPQVAELRDLLLKQQQLMQQLNLES